MPNVDAAKQKAFAGRMAGMLNDAFLAMMTSLGHQTGLFDVMAGLPASTSAEIAEAAGLNERYVREWLGGVTTGGIVEYAAAAGTYRLPPEHAASLTRAVGPANVAAIAQFVGCMGEVEEQIAGRFREGGGLAYADYARFHRIMAQVSGPIVEETLIASTLPLVPGLIDRLREGIDVLDVGCGSGRAINLMAREFPASRFTGYDFSPEAVAAGRAEAAKLGLANVTFAEQDVAAIDSPDGWDFITAFDAIHDQAAPRRVLAGIASALRPGGTFLMVDIQASSHLEKNLDHPLGTYLYAISTLHCMSVSLGLDGEGLGTVWGEELACEMLREAGFTQIDVHRVEGDVFNNFYVARKD